MKSRIEKIILIIIAFISTLAFAFPKSTEYEFRLDDGKGDIVVIRFALKGERITSLEYKGLHFPQEFPGEKVRDFNGSCQEFPDKTTVCVFNYWFSDEEHTRITVSLHETSLSKIKGRERRVGTALQAHSDQGMIFLHKGYLVDVERQ